MTLAEFCEQVMGCKLADWQREAIEQLAKGKECRLDLSSSKQRAHATRAAIEFLAKHRGRET